MKFDTDIAVHRPAHYNAYRTEARFVLEDAIKDKPTLSGIESHYLATVLKYVLRAPFKGKYQDIYKASEYLHYYLEMVAPSDNPNFCKELIRQAESDYKNEATTAYLEGYLSTVVEETVEDMRVLSKNSQDKTLFEVGMTVLTLVALVGYAKTLPERAALAIVLISHTD